MAMPLLWRKLRARQFQDIASTSESLATRLGAGERFARSHEHAGCQWQPHPSCTKPTKHPRAIQECRHCSAAPSPLAAFDQCMGQYQQAAAGVGAGMPKKRSYYEIHSILRSICEGWRPKRHKSSRFTTWLFPQLGFRDETYRAQCCHTEPIRLYRYGKQVKPMKCKYWAYTLVGGFAALVTIAFLFMSGDLMIVGNGTDKPITLKKVSVNGALVDFANGATEKQLPSFNGSTIYEHAAWLSYTTLKSEVELEIEFQTFPNGTPELKRCTYQRAYRLSCTATIVFAAGEKLLCGRCESD